MGFIALKAFECRAVGERKCNVKMKNAISTHTSYSTGYKIKSTKRSHYTMDKNLLSISIKEKRFVSAPFRCQKYSHYVECHEKIRTPR